jgi:hypothetical protein
VPQNRERSRRGALHRGAGTRASFCSSSTASTSETLRVMVITYAPMSQPVRARSSRTSRGRPRGHRGVRLEIRRNQKACPERRSRDRLASSRHRGTYAAPPRPTRCTTRDQVPR